MIFPLAAALLFTLATLLPTLLLGLLWRVLRGPLQRFWRRALLLHLGLLLLHAFVTFPLTLGWLGSRWVAHTRGDEARYAGPRLGADGEWLLQTTASLRDEAAGKNVPDAAVTTAAAARAQALIAEDGVSLRIYRVEARQDPPVAVVILVHGLFRSAMETERPASLLRDLGCECWLLELRNHGGSGRAPFSGGLFESRDVLAAVAHVRKQPGRETLPLGLFGVSLGTIAVAMATPHIDGLGGLVLDAPMERFGAAAERMLTFQRKDDRRSWFLQSQPWRGLVLRSLEYWSDFRLDDVQPIEVLATLAHDLPVLIVGGGEDDRAPSETVRELFARLPMPDAKKRLWIRDGSGHGDVWKDDPAGYRERLAWWISSLRPGR
ncbi:MAG: hypothetical protein RL398_1425 [Planctomycetota bacterium]